MLGPIVTIIIPSLAPAQSTVSPSPSVSDTEEKVTKQVDFTSPDKKFAFLIGHGEYQQTIDLIDKKTEKTLQHITDDDMSSVSYTVRWAPDSKRFALMTRAGHP